MLHSRSDAECKASLGFSGGDGSHRYISDGKCLWCHKIKPSPRAAESDRRAEICGYCGFRRPGGHYGYCFMGAK